jgi:SAM-dependent methyltransferase
MGAKIKTAVKNLITRGFRFTILRRFLWKHVAQRYELRFHVQDASRGESASFRADIARFFESFGFSPEQFRDKTIVDIGARSHLVTSYFQGAEIIAIEPLADKYLRAIPSCGLSKAAKIYSRPAESRIQELKGRADFVISINVLDHLVAFDDVIDNIHFYLKPGGTAFLSFDSHDYIDHMHPTILTEERCINVFERAGFSVARVSRGLGAAGCSTAFPRRSSYGHGEAINFWLVKPQAQ